MNTVGEVVSNLLLSVAAPAAGRSNDLSLISATGDQAAEKIHEPGAL